MGWERRGDKIVHNVTNATKSLVLDMCMMNSSWDNNESILLDSGAMSHSTNCLRDLDNIEKVNQTVRGVASKILTITKKGTWTVGGNLCTPMSRHKEDKLVLNDVLYIPSSKHKIISVPKLDQKGFKVVFGKQQAKVFSPADELLITVEMKQKLYRLYEIQSEDCYSLLEDHETFGHMNFQFIRKMKGLPPESEHDKNPKCEACDQAKIPEQERDKHATKVASKKGAVIHCDISPKHPPTLQQGFVRIIQFIDECTTFVSIVACKTKCEAYEVVKEKILEVESLVAPTKVTKVRSDGAGELVKSKRLKKFYKGKGITLQHSAPYHQYQNGLIERMVRTINEGSRAMMLRANSPEYDWLYAKQYFVYLRNHFYIPAGMDTTPAEVWYGVDKPLVADGPFGCKVMAKILHKRPKSGIAQEEKKSRKCVFLGIDDKCKAYIVRPYDGSKTTRIVRYAKRVSFHSKVFPYTALETPRPTGREEIPSQSDSTFDSEASISDERQLSSEDEEKDTQIEDDPYLSVDEGVDISQDNDSLDEKHVTDEEQTEGSIEPSSENEEETQTRRGRRVKTVDYTKGLNLQKALTNKKNRKEVGVQGVQEEYFYSFVTQTYEEQSFFNQNIFETDRQQLDRLYKEHGRLPDPKNDQEARESPFAKFWLAADTEEWLALKNLEVFKLVSRSEVPPGSKVLNLLKVRKTKYQQHNDLIDKHKTRICCDGSSQNIDSRHTYSPTVVYHSVLLVLMIACYYNLDIETIDIKNFFLRCDMGKDRVYVHQLSGHEEAPRHTHVYRLCKALYGTKNAPRKAQETLTFNMQKSGFNPMKSDPMIFYSKEDSSFTIIAAWVDDLLCVGSKGPIERLKKQLKNNGMDITINQEPKAYTGIQFDRDRILGTMRIHQTEYTREMLLRSKDPLAKKARSPMVKQSLDTQLEELSERQNYECAPEQRTKYQQWCGGLMWLLKTRIDIAFAVGVLCRYMQNPMPCDFQKLHRVLCYVNSTRELGINWKVKGKYGNIITDKMCNELWAHADSDLAGRLDNSRSTSGYCIGFKHVGYMLGVSRMQKVVATGTCQAELICALECAKTIVWYRGFLEELGLKITEPTDLYQDNQPVIDLARNPMHHFRTRHFRIKQHYLRELETNRMIKLIKEKSEHMTADYLNKSQPPDRHIKLRKETMGE